MNTTGCVFKTCDRFHLPVYIMTPYELRRNSPFPCVWLVPSVKYPTLSNGMIIIHRRECNTDMGLKKSGCAGVD
jgi:hypothetical protein